MLALVKESAFPERTSRRAGIPGSAAGKRERKKGNTPIQHMPWSPFGGHTGGLTLPSLAEIPVFLLLAFCHLRC